MPKDTLEALTLMLYLHCYANDFDVESFEIVCLL